MKFFESIKRFLLGSPEEQVILDSLRSGKLVISGHDIVWNRAYYGERVLSNASYITLANASAPAEEYARNYIKLYPDGKVTIFVDGECSSPNSPKFRKSVFRAAYRKLERNRREMTNAVSAQQEAKFNKFFNEFIKKLP